MSVEGTRFADLEERLQANPAEVIDLQLFVGDEKIADNQTVAVADDRPTIEPDTTLRLQVGPIHDRNGHVVPDDTLVDFQLTYGGAELALQMPAVRTRSGFAVDDVLLEQSGTVRIGATSGEATTGEPVTIVVAPSTDLVEDTPPTAVPAPLPVTQTVTATDEPAGSAGAEITAPNIVPPRAHANPATLVVALLTMLITMSLLLVVQIRILPRATLVHNLLWAVIGGLAAYVLYGVGLIPGASWLYIHLDVWAAALVVFVGMLSPLLWLQLRSS